MSKVRQKDTAPELAIQRILSDEGYGFEICARSLPGSPDIVFRQQQVAIFVHGCFWHRHKNCAKSTTPKTRRKFWLGKFVDNQKRDQRNARQLKAMGWAVFIVWECKSHDWSIPSRLLKRLVGSTPVSQ